MYLAELSAANFRIYGPGQAKGAEESAPSGALRVTFQKGLTVLAGENDGGKTAIVDAIRLCLLSSSTEYVRITHDDFHCGVDGPVSELSITCMFKDLNDEEAGAFAEFLTAVEGEGPLLYITLRAQVPDRSAPHRIATTIRSGPKGDGNVIDGTARELLRTTYLRPLRDAEGSLRAGRNSRLSQILNNYPDMKAQDTNDFDVNREKEPTTLVGILKRAEHGIETNPVVKQATQELDRDYLSQFAIGGDIRTSRIGIASSASLQHILERLELTFAPYAENLKATRHGLGYNNALFMAAELLLLGKHGLSPILLIEEPEAHLHPQLQSRVMELLHTRSEDPDDPVQVIVTTHSPHLAASVPVERLAVVSHGMVFPLLPEQTRLDRSDYAFLSRFLDATKANLFFARSVVIVEGDAEAILIPALARAAKRSFNSAGVSIVNVGHTGLFRYARIFQRNDDLEFPIRVACLRDRDLFPEGVDEDLREELGKKLRSANEMTPEELKEYLDGLKKPNGQSVHTYVSDHWTFEYDLAAKSWELASIMHQAASAARVSKNVWPEDDKLQRIFKEAKDQVDRWREEGVALAAAAGKIYSPLRKSYASKSITAQYAAGLVLQDDVKITDDMLPDYLVDAFTYVCGEAR